MYAISTPRFVVGSAWFFEISVHLSSFTVACRVYLWIRSFMQSYLLALDWFTYPIQYEFLRGFYLRIDNRASWFVNNSFPELSAVILCTESRLLVNDAALKILFICSLYLSGVHISVFPCAGLGVTAPCRTSEAIAQIWDRAGEQYG